MELRGIFDWFKSSLKWVENTLFTSQENEVLSKSENIKKTPVSFRDVPERRGRQGYVMVVGCVRTGKTSLCRALGEKVKVNLKVNGRDEQTDDGFEFYEIKDKGITLIDTPGLGHDPTEDFETLEKLSSLVKTLQYCQFILTIHGQHPRLTQKHQQGLRWLTSCLGRRYLKSTVVVFNFWDWDEGAEATRERSGETEEAKTSSVNKYLRATFSVTHDVPVTFLNNYPDLSDERQRRRLEGVREELRDLTGANANYNADVTFPADTDYNANADQ